MRTAFAHDATLKIALGDDDGAPGAAITVALCGHWEHDPPCPLAPHHTTAVRVGDQVRLRTLFVVEPALEDTVRRSIDTALASCRLVGPGGVTTTWQVQSSHRSDVVDADLERAERLIRS